MYEEINKNKHHNSVGIIGCGWVGKVLAQKLLKRNIPVLATSSKIVNVEKLAQQSISAKQLTLPTAAKDLVQHDVFAQQSLVIAITPQLRQGKTDYAEKIAQLVAAAEQVSITERIILLSSTAIYDGLAGEVNENSTLDLSTEKVQILNAAEQAVLNFSKQGVVLRLAGLVGPERHPGKFILANKTLSNSTAPVNLIHQQDAVGIIESLLETKYSQKVFNGVSDTHVSKAQYYQAAAKGLGLSPPVIAQESTEQVTKMVLGNKTKHILGYQLVYPDLLTWL